MNSPSTYPCIWLHDNMDKVLAKYKKIFLDLAIEEQSSIACTFTAMGSKMMLLQGGPMFAPNEAISYFIYTGDKDSAAYLFNALQENGRVLFPLQSYPWAACYGWVEDEFGVHWQIDGDVMHSSQKIVPCLLFVHEKRFRIREALAYYSGIFPHFKVLMEAPLEKTQGIPEDAILFTQVKFGESLYNLMCSREEHYDFDFSPGNSFVIPCFDQAEIDYYWESLGKDGAYEMCGWLRDKYGVSWQVIPAILPELLKDPVKGPQVMEAFLKMQKFDLSVLLAI